MFYAVCAGFVVSACLQGCGQAGTSLNETNTTAAPAPTAAPSSAPSSAVSTAAPTTAAPTTVPTTTPTTTTTNLLMILWEPYFAAMVDAADDLTKWDALYDSSWRPVTNLEKNYYRDVSSGSSSLNSNYVAIVRGGNTLKTSSKDQFKPTTTNNTVHLAIADEVTGDLTTVTSWTAYPFAPTPDHRMRFDTYCASKVDGSWKFNSWDYTWTGVRVNFMPNVRTSALPEPEDNEVEVSQDDEKAEILKNNTQDMLALEFERQQGAWTEDAVLQVIYWDWNGTTTINSYEGIRIMNFYKMWIRTINFDKQFNYRSICSSTVQAFLVPKLETGLKLLERRVVMDDANLIKYDLIVSHGSLVPRSQMLDSPSHWQMI